MGEKEHKINRARIPILQKMVVRESFVLMDFSRPCGSQNIMKNRTDNISMVSDQGKNKSPAAKNNFLCIRYIKMKPRSRKCIN